MPQSTSASGGAELVLWPAGHECAQVSFALPVPVKPCAGAGRSNKAPRGQLMRCLPPSPARAVLGLPAHGAGAGLCGDPRCCPWGHPAWSCSCPHSRAPGDTPADRGQLQGCPRVGRGWCCSPCSCWGLLAPGRAPALCPLLGTGAGLLPKGVARHGSPAAPGSAAQLQGQRGRRGQGCLEMWLCHFTPVGWGLQLQPLVRAVPGASVRVGAAGRSQHRAGRSPPV